jgi:hypothetical protein
MSDTTAFDRSGYVEAFFQPFRMIGYFFLMLLTGWLTSCAVMIGVVTIKWDNNLGPANEHLRYVVAEAFEAGGIRSLKERAVPWVLETGSKLGSFFVSNTIASADPILGAASRGSTVTTLVPSAELASKLWMLKSLLLVSMLPVVVLGYVAGYIDGLVNRSIRRDVVGREQSGLYHRGKFGFATISTAFVLGYTALPLNIPLAPLVLVYAAAGFLLAKLQWENYKKYR